MTEIAQMLACLRRIESSLAAIFELLEPNFATGRKCEECGIRFSSMVTARRRFCSDYCRVKWHRLNNPRDAAE